jgi:hypothetical protein
VDVGSIEIMSGGSDLDGTDRGLMTWSVRSDAAVAEWSLVGPPSWRRSSSVRAASCQPRASAKTCNAAIAAALAQDVRQPISAIARDTDLPESTVRRTGRRPARHPAVHGAFATIGRGNLHVAVWLPTVEDLYEFITNDLADPGITAIDTMLVGRAT